MESQISRPGTVEWLGVTYRTILEKGQTGGTLSVTESVSPPASGPPRHIHHDADETFVLMTGQAEFWLAGDRFTRGPGEAVFVPRGTEHTFRVIGEMPCRHLVILNPGGFEAFFAQMARKALRIPKDMQAIAEIAARYHLTFTGPPLGDA